MLETTNAILWAIATALIIMSSIYFTIRLRGVQFHFKDMIQNLFHKPENDIGIKPIQSLMMTLGSRIGVGSIAGVALAIYLGGVGSIFWMWVIAILAATNTFAETVLGIVYREKDGKDQYKGGPSFYIKNGLFNKKLGGFYAVLILLSYVGGFVGIQANTITKSLNEIITVPNFIVGIVVCILTSFIIFGGIKKIASFTEKLVPFMTAFYLLVALYVTIRNFPMIPGIFWSIVKGAFNVRAIGGSILGTMIIGIQRGIFSNEAGLGTGSISSSASSVENPARQGYIQIIGIYVTTLLICTATAIIILTSNYQTLQLHDVNGIEITQYAFQFHLGNFGSIAVFISILLFSFSTILTGYYDGEMSLKYFLKNPKLWHTHILKLVSIGVIFVGSIMSSEKLWNYVDILTALLAIINIYSLIALRKQVREEYQNYKSLKKCGKIK